MQPRTSPSDTQYYLFTYNGVYVEPALDPYDSIIKECCTALIDLFVDMNPRESRKYGISFWTPTDGDVIVSVIILPHSSRYPPEYGDSDESTESEP